MSSSVPLLSITLPGYRGPIAGFGALFEMRGACHWRFERMLRFLAVYSNM